MTISWDEFSRLFALAESELEQAKELAETQRDEDRKEYERLCQSVFESTSKILESTGAYTPPIMEPALREQWNAMKTEADAIRRWLLQNKGSLWPQS